MPAGRLMVQLLGALAEFERELIRDRVRSGITRVKATGRTRSGNPRSVRSAAPGGRARR